MLIPTMQDKSRERFDLILTFRIVQLSNRWEMEP